MVPNGTKVNGESEPVKSREGAVAESALEDRKEAVERGSDSARSRIIAATFHALVEHGYAGASTREIAKRAKVSKRELYTLFGSKQGILAAMVRARSERARLPLGLPEVGDRAALAQALIRFGETLVGEICQPAVMALFRLAVIEAERSPVIARIVDEHGRGPIRAALTDFLARAQACSLIGGATPEAMASEFLALLWGDLQIILLMRLSEAPAPAEIQRRAQAAVAALLSLHPEPLAATATRS
jgi:AcrR family transcriptional regulator